MSKPDADVVVLDLDNTLVRLEVDWAAVREELHQLAVDAGSAPPEPKIGILMEGAARPGSEKLRAAMEKTLTDAEVAGAGGPLNELLMEWLDGPAAGLPVSILSLNSRQAVTRALELQGLDERVSHVAGREDVGRGKPDPEGMHLLARRHEVEPARILFIGDADTDRTCAERAGAQFIHVDEIGTRWA